MKSLDQWCFDTHGKLFHDYWFIPNAPLGYSVTKLGEGVEQYLNYVVQESQRQIAYEVRKEVARIGKAMEEVITK